MAARQRKDYLDTEEGQDMRRSLQAMLEDPQFNTVSAYSANTSLYPDNIISFIDVHMNYLIAHPALEASTYVSNLRLKTRKR